MTNSFDLCGGVKRGHPAQAFDAFNGIYIINSHSSSILIRHPNPSGFRVWSILHTFRLCTSKIPGITIGSKLHSFLFARLATSLSCRPCISTSRIGTGRLCEKQPTPFTGRATRTRSGPRWKTALRFILQGMIDGHCDLDLFLYPFFMHLPSLVEMCPWYPGLGDSQKNIANLISALTRLDPAES